MDSAGIVAITGIISSIISLIEKLDPTLAQNKVLEDLQKAISTLQSLGL